VGRPGILLTTARTDAETTVGGSVALGWSDLLRRPTADLRRRRAQVLADLLALRLRVQSGLLAVVDAAVFGLGPTPAALRPIGTHVLLASPDPVALDATVARWCGFDPAHIPHLRACADRDLGVLNAGEIRLVGEPELLAMAPGCWPAAGGTLGPGAGGAGEPGASDAERTGAGDGAGRGAAHVAGAPPQLPPSSYRAPPFSRMAGLLRRSRAENLVPVAVRCADLLTFAALRRRRRWRRFLTSPWGRLWDEYRAAAARGADAA
jgi:hypothetical protein